MTITAVVVTYWQERRPNVARIVSDLLAGSVPPDRVIVLNNAGDCEPFVDGLPGLLDDRVRVLDAWNTETRGKFTAGLLASPAEWYVLADDDTTVGPRTVEALIEAAGHTGAGSRFVSGYWGVTLAPDGSFMHGTIHQPALQPRPRLVDAFHGRVIFAGHQALARLVAAEGPVRGDGAWPVEGDDLLIGLANEGTSYVVPLAGESAFVDLSDGGVAMQHRPGYFDMRDVFARDALARLRAAGLAELPHVRL